MSKTNLQIMRDRLVSRASMVVLAAATVMTPSTVFAQDEDEFRDTIIVTARNREESVQDIPLAITAFSQEDFVRRNIENLDDVARLTAGLSFEDFSGGFATPVIRGQTQTRITALEANVSTFLDGVYIPRSWAIDLGTANLNRIEVVKGPQSARYGRNAFAGAINYVPFKATLSDVPLSGQATGTIGSDERFDGGIRANIAFGDRIAIAGSFDYSTFDGSFENDHPFADVELDQGTSGNVGGFENNSFSASIVVNPVDPLNIEFSYNKFDVQNEARAGQNNNQGAGDLNCGGTSFTNSRLFCGELPVTDTATIDPRSFAVDAETDIFRVGATYDFTDALQLSYVFGRVDGEVLAIGSSESDQVGCNLLFPNPLPFMNCAFTASPTGGIEYNSHEARLVYDAQETWRIEVGGFFSTGEDVFFTTFPASPITFTGLTDASLITPITDAFTFAPADSDLIETDVWAVFGAFQWTSPDSRFRFGAEVRYSETEVTSTQSASGNQFTENSNVITPRITAEYNVNDNSLAYATIARGAKAGGINPNAISDDLVRFDEELNWTYEIGLKNQFFDNRVVFNVAGFYTDWSELQIAAVDPLNFSPFATAVTQNLGNARVFGVELEGSFQVTDNLSVDGTFSYNDAQYDEGTIDARFAQSTIGFFLDTTTTSCDDIVCSSDGDVGGNQIERTPSTQLSFGSQWEDEIPAWNASYYIRGDLSWQSEFFASPVNLATIPDRFLLGASAGIVFENIDISVWARNLTDETFVSNTFVIVAPFGNAYNSFFGDRRTYGATVKLSF